MYTNQILMMNVKSKNEAYWYPVILWLTLYMCGTTS